MSASQDAYKFYVYDYREETPQFSTTDKNEFIGKANEHITSDATITEVNYYCKPLDYPFIRLFSKRSIGSHRIQHQFVAFTFQKQNEEKVHVSIDKNRDGIILQIAGRSELVVEKLKNKSRCKVSKISSTDYESLDNLVNIKPSTIETVLELLETKLEYKLLTCNCQTLVSEVEKIISQISHSVKLKFCGSADPVSLGSKGKDGLCELVCQRFPVFVNNIGGLTTIPEENFPHTLVSPDRVVVDKDKEAVYKDLHIRDQVNGRITELLKLKSKTKSMLFFNNLYRNKMSLKLQQAVDAHTDNPDNPNLTEDLCQKIADFWTMFFDGIMMSTKYGIVIVQISSGKTNTATDMSSSPEAMEARKQLMTKLLELGLTKDETVKVPISSVIIKVGNEKNDVESKDSLYEFTVTEECIESKRTDEENYFEQSLNKCLKSIKKSAKNVDSEQLQFAAGKLLALQYLENADVLLHNRIANQHGMQSHDSGESAIIWSKEQQPIVDKILVSFYTGELLRMFITGCPGSGKTFILIHCVDQYLSIEPTKKVLFVIPAIYSTLKKQVQNKLCWKDQKNRIIFKDKLHGTDINHFGLIVWDECSTEDFGWHNLRDSQSHFLAVSMYKLIETRDKRSCVSIGSINGFVYEEKSVGGVNYRSGHQIIKLAVDVEQEYNNTFIANTIPIDATIPSHIKDINCKKTLQDFTDESATRDVFVRSCVEYLLERFHSRPPMTPTLIYNLCHMTLLDKVQRSLKEKMKDDDFKHLYFLTPKESQGAEFSTSIGIVDPVTLPYDILEACHIAVTRTFREVHLLINTSKVPYAIHEDYESVMFESHPKFSWNNVIQNTVKHQENDNHSGKVKVWCDFESVPMRDLEDALGFKRWIIVKYECHREARARLREVEEQIEHVGVKIEDAHLVVYNRYNVAIFGKIPSTLSTRAPFIVMEYQAEMHGYGPRRTYLQHEEGGAAAFTTKYQHKTIEYFSMLKSQSN